MGDEGSGYALGRSALTAVGRAFDGRGPTTGLTDAVMEGARLGTFNELVRWSVTALPTEVASLALPVLRLAREGDKVATELVELSARELVALVIPLLDSFGGKAPPVATAGGLLDQEPLKTYAKQALAEHNTGMREDALDPVAGALQLASGL
jgi:N-acetylglucosamine kinase-like BadF-type ATPase